MSQHSRNLPEQARLYALADKSDPFAYNRAMSHLASGISTTFRGYGQDADKEAFYSAEEATETRLLPDGREYQATVYRNMVRP